MDRKRRDTFLIGIGSGLVLGSLIGMIFSPYSGKELRMKLDDLKVDIKDRTNRFREPQKYSRIKV